MFDDHQDNQEIADFYEWFDESGLRHAEEEIDRLNVLTASAQGASRLYRRNRNLQACLPQVEEFLTQSSLPECKWIDEAPFGVDFTHYEENLSFVVEIADAMAELLATPPPAISIITLTKRVLTNRLEARERTPSTPADRVVRELGAPPKEKPCSNPRQPRPPCEAMSTTDNFVMAAATLTAIE